MTSNEKISFATKQKFLLKHGDLAHGAFDKIEDADTCHNTDAATELVRFARRECGYSKYTSKVDIFASLLRAWSALEEAI